MLVLSLTTSGVYALWLLYPKQRYDQFVSTEISDATRVLRCRSTTHEGVKKSPVYIDMLGGWCSVG